MDQDYVLIHVCTNCWCEVGLEPIPGVADEDDQEWMHLVETDCYDVQFQEIKVLRRHT